MCPPGRLACPGDFSPWCVSPAGETDPVHHRTLQRREEGDCGEPLPVSRAASTGREGERHPKRTWPSHRAADAALGRLSWGCEGLGWGGTSSAGSHGCPRERSSQNTGQGVGQINILRAQGQRKRFIETTRPHIPRKQKKEKDSPWASQRQLCRDARETAVSEAGRDLGPALHFVVQSSAQHVSLE